MLDDMGFFYQTNRLLHLLIIYCPAMTSGIQRIASFILTGWLMLYIFSSFCTLMAEFANNNKENVDFYFRMLLMLFF